MSNQSAYTIILRKEAKASGLIRYYTGQPCKYGHVTERFVKTGQCLECTRITNRATNKDWYESNKEQIKTKSKNYYEINKEKIRERTKEYAKEYQKNNKSKVAARASKRRALKLSATPFWADLERIAEVFKECERISKETGIKHHVDHIVPLKHSRVCGLHIHTNLQILSAKDNQTKSNRFEIE